MSNQNIVKFTTFGPNRGLSLIIGAYEFVNGVCEVPEKDAPAASSILTRYHDVCYSHELDQKIAEYDTKYQNREAAKSSNPHPETPKKPATTPVKSQNPESGQTPPATSSDKPDEKEGGDGSASDEDGDKKNGGGKKPPVKN